MKQKQYGKKLKEFGGKVNGKTGFLPQNRTKNVNLLFNMIQACRNDLSIMRFNPKYGCKPDRDLIKCVEALEREAKQWMTESV